MSHLENQDLVFIDSSLKTESNIYQERVFKNTSAKIFIEHFCKELETSDWIVHLSSEMIDKKKKQQDPRRGYLRLN